MQICLPHILTSHIKMRCSFYFFLSLALPKIVFNLNNVLKSTEEL